MRTNVEIDDEILRQAMAASGESTKKAAVTEALRLVVQLKRQEAIRELFGKVQWDGDLDQMRESRFPAWDANAKPARKTVNEPAA
jgi:Arc/MetJ family transcription regulator